jgi:hypothetical protein
MIPLSPNTHYSPETIGPITRSLNSVQLGWQEYVRFHAASRTLLVTAPRNNVRSVTLILTLPAFPKCLHLLVASVSGTMILDYLVSCQVVPEALHPWKSSHFLISAIYNVGKSTQTKPRSLLVYTQKPSTT